MTRKAKPDSDENPKKVAMHTVKLNSAQAEKLRGILVAKRWVSFPVDHSAFAFKGENLNIVHYKSGKCVISGKGTEDFVKFTLEPDVTGQALLGYEEENNPEWFEEHAGLDESGKGDLFGPVVSACVIASGDVIRAWIDLGIKDSKKLTDPKIAELDRAIRSTPGVAVKTTFMRMAKYNELHSRFGKNLNRLLGWMHATSCEEALKNYEEMNGRRPKWGLLDQFSEEPIVQKELARKGVEFDLRMRTKAESDPVVAAASIVARAAFVRELDRLSADGNIHLPKGSGSEAKNVAIELVGRLGPAILVNFAKLHFKTAYEARGLEPPAPKPFKGRKKAE
ncbi:MAG: ribonuclease HIII [Verrucomicrobia bacterium]|nr:ribonuclease HIII [Verrucomicrobiota bacterium]NBY36795.1 ribonuclease HIII [Verrucomicrobiota bacterium]